MNAIKENKVFTFDGGVTEANIEKWKKIHRKVIRVDVEDEGELHVGYFHRPSMETMGAVTKIAKTDEIRSGQALFDGCWLGGSEILRTDSVLFVAVMQQLNKALSVAMGSLKNL